jgi:hypothetical protein
MFGAIRAAKVIIASDYRDPYVITSEAPSQ